MECLIADFLGVFYRKILKFGFWVAGWVLIIKSKYFTTLCLKGLRRDLFSILR